MPKRHGAEDPQQPLADDLYSGSPRSRCEWDHSQESSGRTPKSAFSAVVSQILVQGVFNYVLYRYWDRAIRISI